MCCNRYNLIFRRFVFGVGLSLLLCFSPLVGFAQSADDDSFESPLTLADLSPEGRLAVSNLAVAMVSDDIRSSATTGDYDATISANVASILALLNSVKTGTSNYARFSTAPFTFVGNNTQLGAHLNLLFTDDGGTIAAAPDRHNTFLYEIQRALYGQSGVPSANAALLPLFSNYVNWTNLLFDSSSGQPFLYYPSMVADDIVSSALNWYQVAAFFDSIPSVPGTWSDLWNTLYMGSSNISASTFSNGPEPYEGTGLYVMEGALNDVWIHNIADATTGDSGLVVVDPVNSAKLDVLETAINAVRSSVESLSGAVSESSDFVVSNVVTDIGGGEIGQDAFGYSFIGSTIADFTTGILTNNLSDSVFAVNTNALYGITNAALPSLSPVLSWAESSVNFFSGVPETDPSLTIFSSFEHNGIVIPSMVLDLSDPRISTLQTKCHQFCVFIYAALGVFLCVFRVKSFLEYITQGFALAYGDAAMEAGSSLGESSGDKPFGGMM